MPNRMRESWVGVVETIYQVYNRQNRQEMASGAMLNQLSEVIPNFFNLRPTVALRLKQLIQSKLFAAKADYRDCPDLVSAIKNHPELLTKDLSVKKLTQVEAFFQAHLDGLQQINFQLLNEGRSVDEILDCLNFLSKLDLALFGILETLILEDNRVQRYDLDRDEILGYLIKQNLPKLKETLEEVFKRRLEKNTVVRPEERFNIAPFGRWVKELTQNDELVLEGKNMNHCVGGYGEKVKRNESRIFHIQVGKNSSTIEVGIYLQKIVPKTDKQIKKPEELKQVKLAQRVHPQEPSKFIYEYSFEVVNRRTGESKYYFKPMPDPKHQKNFFTEKYTISFHEIQHRAKYNGNPAKANQKVAELLLKYLNSEVSRNAKWLQKIIKDHISPDNKPHRWPYLKLNWD